MLKIFLSAIFAVTVMAGSVFADEARDAPGQREAGSLGDVVTESIAEGTGTGIAEFTDGGLANQVEQGDLSATLDLIDPVDPPCSTRKC